MARAVAATPEYAKACRRRKKVEMLFAHLKRILRLDRLRLRGPSGAKDEFLLAATAPNFRKLAKLIPLPTPAAGPWSLRKSAIVLKSGVSRPVSHIISTLRAVSRSKRRLDWIWLTVAVDVDLQHRRGMVGRTARRFRHDALKPQPPQIQLVNEDVGRPHPIVFSYVVVKKLREQNALRSLLALDKALHQEPQLNPLGF